MTDYILSEEQLQKIERWKNTPLLKEYRSRPYSSQKGTSDEWIISYKDYHIALEYFHLEARPLIPELKKEITIKTCDECGGKYDGVGYTKKDMVVCSCCHYRLQIIQEHKRKDWRESIPK